MSSPDNQSDGDLDGEGLNRLTIDDDEHPGSPEGSPVKEPGSHIAGAFIGE